MDATLFSYHLLNMAATSPAALANLAKKHLGLPSSTPVSYYSIAPTRLCTVDLMNFLPQDKQVPYFYLQELSRHLVLYPLGDNVSFPTNSIKGTLIMLSSHSSVLRYNLNLDVSQYMRVFSPTRYGINVLYASF